MTFTPSPRFDSFGNLDDVAFEARSDEAFLAALAGNDDDRVTLSAFEISAEQTANDEAEMAWFDEMADREYEAFKAAIWDWN